MMAWQTMLGMRPVYLVPIVATTLYFLAATVLFDFTKPALAHDVETRDGRPVAFGPRPRSFTCQPFYAGMFYDGEEWPFRVFWPVCAAWRGICGYEAA